MEAHKKTVIVVQTVYLKVFLKLLPSQEGNVSPSDNVENTSLQIQNKSNYSKKCKDFDCNENGDEEKDWNETSDKEDNGADFSKLDISRSIADWALNYNIDLATLASLLLIFCTSGIIVLKDPQIYFAH